MTPDYCSFQSGPLSGSAIKIKHHHCHKIACSWNLVNLIMGQRVTSTDPWPTWPTQICWPTWPVTRWPIVISVPHRSRASYRSVRQVSAIADGPARRVASSASCCTQSWTPSATNWPSSSVERSTVARIVNFDRRRSFVYRTQRLASSN